MASATIAEQGRILYVWTGTEWVPVSAGSSGVQTYYQSEQPAEANIGDLWIDEDGSFDSTSSKPVYIWNGSIWVSIGDGGGLPLSGGVIDGNLEVTGNFILSSASPAFQVDRPSDPNVSIRWNESEEKWQFTNDGVDFKELGTSAVIYQSASPDGVALDLEVGTIWVDSDADLAAAIGESHIHPQYLSLVSASSDYLKILDASNTYLDLSTASTVYATKDELNNIDLSPYLTLSSASSTYLTIAAFEAVEFLPDQTGNDGKYLFTNGASASWESVEPVPAGGTKEELLAKNSNTDYDADWVDINQIIVNPLLLMGA